MKKLTSFLIVLFPIYALSSDGKLNLIEQLPEACGASYQPGYDKNQACFPSTVGNFITLPSVQGNSWRQFTSLNWMVEPNTVGLADFDYNLTGKNDTYPVWQSWMTLNDFYLSKGKDENTWFKSDSYIPKSCQKYIDKDVNGTSLLSTFLTLNSNVPKGPKIQVLTMEKTASNNSVYDRNNNKLRFQVYINNVAYADLLRDENKIASGGVQFQSGTLSFAQNIGRRGAIIAKAAWKVLDNSALVGEKKGTPELHRGIAFIVDEDDSNRCDLDVVGLVGLHIVSRAIDARVKCGGDCERDTNVDLWTWATYEYKKNAPTITQFNNNDYKDIDWLFFDDSKDKLLISTYCLKNNVAELTKYSETEDSECPINNPRYKPSLLVSNEYEVINGYTPESMMAETVWNNYRMVGVQWNEKDQIKSSFNGGKLSNAVLEPFMPLSGCSQCHGENKNPNGTIRNQKIFLKNNSISKNRWSTFNLQKHKETL